MRGVLVPGLGWGGLCGDWGEFGNREANVTCRALGFKQGVRLFSSDPSSQPEGGPKLVRRVVCPLGSEASLDKCVLERPPPFEAAMGGATWRWSAREA